MEIQQINNYTDLLNIESELKVFLRNVDHTIFSTPEWLCTWWKHLGFNNQMLLLIFRDNNVIVGFAPLMLLAEKHLWFTSRRIEFIGTPEADYHNFIFETKRQEAYTLLIEYILDKVKGWHYIRLSDVPAHEVVKLFENTPRESLLGLNIIAQILEDCPYIELPNNVDSFLSTLSGQFRRNLRKSKRLLEDEYRLEFVDYSNPELVQKGMNIHFKLHENRWRSKNQSGVFGNINVKNFHLDLACKLSKKNLLYLTMLHADDNPIASIYGFKYNSTFSYYTTGMNSSFAKFGVGNLLLLETIQKCIRDGISKFDFLRGNEFYKYRWSAKSKKNYEIILTKNGLFQISRYRLEKSYQILANNLISAKKNFLLAGL